MTLIIVIKFYLKSTFLNTILYSYVQRNKINQQGTITRRMVNGNTKAVYAGGQAIGTEQDWNRNSSSILSKVNYRDNRD